jgi:hypothetical protein
VSVGGFATTTECAMVVACKRADDETTTWTNPLGIDLQRPYIYFIKVHAPKREFRYVGKGKAESRMDQYGTNVGRALAGQPKRPAVKRDGSPQSAGNTRFRYVHLVLATAVRQGWRVEHYPLETCEAEVHRQVEDARRIELACNMNDRPSWAVEDFARLSQALIDEVS